MNLLPLYMTYRDDRDVIVGAALAFAETSRRAIINMLGKRMLLYATPAVMDSDMVMTDFLVELERYCREQGFVKLNITSYASPDISRQFGQLDYNQKRRYEFLIDLDHTEEHMWKGFSATLRKNINGAGRNGVIIRELPVDASIASLQELSKVTAERIFTRKGVDFRQSRSEKITRANTFIESGLGRFVSALIDGEIVSTSLFSLFNGMVNHMLGGANEKAMKAQASKLLMWDTIKYYRETGARIFNLGGCGADATEPDSSEHGVYSFKKSFGAEIVECSNGEKILGAKRTRLIGLLKSIAGK